MVCRVIPIAYGNHNNLYFFIKHKKLKINIKAVVYFDTCEVRLLKKTLHKDIIKRDLLLTKDYIVL